jgi:sugar phosphate isomerase/epimerase
VTTLSIYSRTWPSADAASLASTIRDSGFTNAHLSLASVGLGSLPETLDADELTTIRKTFERAGVRITSVSATYNLIDPDRARRRRDTDRAIGVIRHAPLLGADLVSLCTGTRNPDNMWAGHPDNASAEAWDEFRETLAELVDAARESGVTLGVEPERGNIIAGAREARRLLDELGADAAHIGIIIDPGNIIDVEHPETQGAILTEAFDLLGPHVEVLHAKDSAPDGDAAPGQGVVDFDLVFARWAALPKSVPVILHNIRVDQVAESRRYVLARIAAT